MTCERRPTHTTAHKTPGDNGFSIKILGLPPTTDFYEPGHDYTGELVFHFFPVCLVMLKEFFSDK